MDELGISASTLPHQQFDVPLHEVRPASEGPSLFEEMKVKNIKPDNLTCFLLMTSHAALNKIDVVGEVLEEMQENDVVLGWYAYSMVSIYLSAGLVLKNSPLRRNSRALLLEGNINIYIDRSWSWGCLLPCNIT